MSKSKTPISFDDVVAADTSELREQAIDSLLSRMKLWEKIMQLTGAATLLDLLIMPVRYNHRAYPSGENKRLNIPPILFTDGPRGVGIGRSTCFPAAIARGATWNVELEERVAEAMGIEARAQGANFFAGICINIPRHPGWGRTQETFSEASHLLGEMAVADVKGLQGHVMACVKHFACNSMEEARFKVDVLIDDKTLHEVYLPHFRRALEAGAASFMSAYNKVNGEFCGHNKNLLTEILKEQWGFDGFVMSDFLFGVRSPDAIQYGLDVEMPFAIQFARRLFFRVRAGELDVSHVDDSVRRVLRKKAEFAPILAENPPKLHMIANAEHCILAREACQQSLVLLKNKDSVLPLAPSLKSIAILGPLANRPNLGDRGSSRVRPPYVATVLDGLRERLTEETEVLPYSGESLSTSCAYAARAELSVLVVGLDWRHEGEYLPVLEMGGDREDLALPQEQIELIESVAAVSAKCIVILMSGSAVLTEPWLSKVDALLLAWYPGMEGGRAVTDVLFGDVPPQGCLPLTFPATNEQLPPFDKSASSMVYEPFHGYRWYESQGLRPAFPLGFGLSYTEFDYGPVQANWRSEEELSLALQVSNIGKYAGVALVMVLCARSKNKKTIEPAQLCAFTRVNLNIGESELVRLNIQLPKSYNPQSKGWERHTSGFELRIGPNVLDVQRLALTAV